MLGVVLAVLITNGAPASDAAVVALAHGDVLLCSGSVVAPHVVLTAAHCVAGTAAADLPDVVVGDTVAGAAERRAAVAAFVHPAYDSQTGAHDVALVVVGAALSPAPLALAADLGGAAVGTDVRVVGYGWTVANDPAPPQRRAGTSRITASDADGLDSVGDPAQPCDGDSGGPALADGGAGEQIVGVASSGDVMCIAVARHARVDAAGDSAAFLAERLAALAEHGTAAGDRCWYADQCAAAAGTCTPALDDARLSFCAPACTPACPSGLACEGGLCRHAAPSPGAAGAPCAANADCEDALCLAPDAATAATCTVRCFTDIPGFTCPAPLACSLATDGQDACFAPPATSPSDDGGCAAGGTASAGGTALFVALLALALLSIARPRRGSPR